jgi:uncharacterized protein (UPF0254 family)
MKDLKMIADTWSATVGDLRKFLTIYGDNPQVFEGYLNSYLEDKKESMQTLSSRQSVKNNLQAEQYLIYTQCKALIL